MAGSTTFRLPFQPICCPGLQASFSRIGQYIGLTRERYHATYIPFLRCMAIHVTEHLVSLALAAVVTPQLSTTTTA